MHARADTLDPVAPPSWRDANAAGLRHAREKAWPDAARAFAQAAQSLGHEGREALKSKDAQVRAQWGNAFALVLANLAQAEFQRGRPAAAITAAERALDVRLKTGSAAAPATARVRSDLAILLVNVRRHDDAARVLDEGLAAMTSAAHDPVSVQSLLEQRARITVQRRDAGDARERAVALRALLDAGATATPLTTKLLEQLDALVVAAERMPSPMVTATTADIAPTAAAVAAPVPALIDATVLEQPVAAAIDGPSVTAVRLAHVTPVAPTPVVMEAAAPALIDLDAIPSNTVADASPLLELVELVEVVSDVPATDAPVFELIDRAESTSASTVEETVEPAETIAVIEPVEISESYDIFPPPTPPLGVVAIDAMPRASASAAPVDHAPVVDAIIDAPAASAVEATTPFTPLTPSSDAAEPECAPSTAELAPVVLESVAARADALDDTPAAHVESSAPSFAPVIDGSETSTASIDVAPVVTDIVAPVEDKATRGTPGSIEAVAPNFTRTRTGPIDAVPPTAATRPSVMRSLEHFFDEFGRPQSGKQSLVDDPDDAFDGTARVELTPVASASPVAALPSVPETPVEPMPSRTIALDDEIFGGAAFDILLPTPPAPSSRTTGGHDATNVGMGAPTMAPLPVPAPLPPQRPSMTLGFVVEHGLPAQVDYEAPPPPDVVLPVEPTGHYMPRANGTRDITMGAQRSDGAIPLTPAPEVVRPPISVPVTDAPVTSAAAAATAAAPGRAERATGARPRVVPESRDIETPLGNPVVEVPARHRRKVIIARQGPGPAVRAAQIIGALAVIGAGIWFVVLPAVRG
ncbi:MAG: tetratricopeptide repeat protein [Gemmatimonadaceae bacterium]|jgi:hypothetical protein|nr:tetratricopeptide repeat protein [Gemmatimonadaceae bacterium]